jgi:hypothetical protein
MIFGRGVFKALPVRVGFAFRKLMGPSIELEPADMSSASAD